MSDEATIPPGIRLVRDFINTFEPQLGQESWTSPERLRDWFVERRLIPDDARLRPWDLTLAVTLREGLRAVLVGHDGQRTDTAAVEALNEVLAEVPVRLAFTDHHGYHLASAGSSPIDNALARLVDAIRQCGEDHTWSRLKVCARDTCRWAFYDASRNQARRWCSMAGCGTHIKNQRAYAARTRRTRQPSDDPAHPAVSAPQHSGLREDR